MKCFLAANSAEGFVSYFKECYKPFDDFKAYIIKGGPGTGKSSFMRKILKEASERKISADEVYCASDPSSLDGVILKDIKTVFLDGTAPHTVEPALPGISDCMLDFGQFWDSDILRQNKDVIIKLLNKNRTLHRSAAKHINSAGKIIKEQISSLPKKVSTNKLFAAADSLCDEFIPFKTGIGNKWNRFLGGITPNGAMYFTDSLPDSKVLIKDSCGVCANSVLQRIAEKAISCGYEVVIFKNPILPNTLTDVVLIPELDICFVWENIFFRCKNFSKTVALCDTDENRFEEEVKRETETAADYIKKAKEIHDELEGYYISAMDFEKVNSFTEEFIKSF